MPLNNNNTQDYTSIFTNNGIQGRNQNVTIGGSVGYNGDIGWKAPVTQIVTIVSSKDANNPDNINVIRGLLDKPFSLSTSSNWDVFNPVPSQLSGFGDAINAGVQAGTGLLNGGNTYSSVSIYSTRRVWKGSDPLSLTLDINFYAVNDAYKEVLSPCMRLERLALPSYDGLVPFLQPPGPNPFSFNVQSGQATGGDIIEIYVGTLLYFGSVIVKRCTVTFDNKYDVNGYPLKASVQIDFETFQVATKQDISNMVTPNLSQPAPLTVSGVAQTLGADLTQSANAVGNFLGNLLNG